LWILGRHRLLCGDSTGATDVERVLAGVEPHLMVTDPLYGVNYNPEWSNQVIRENGTRVAAATSRISVLYRTSWGKSTSPEIYGCALHRVLRSKIMYLRRAACDGQSTVRG
jgi:hypothetical protein